MEASKVISEQKTSCCQDRDNKKIKKMHHRCTSKKSRKIKALKHIQLPIPLDFLDTSFLKSYWHVPAPLARTLFLSMYIYLVFCDTSFSKRVTSLPQNLLFSIRRSKSRFRRVRYSSAKSEMQGTSRERFPRKNGKTEFSWSFLSPSFFERCSSPLWKMNFRN